MSYLKFVFVFLFVIFSSVIADVSEITQQRPRFSLKSGFRDPNTFNVALTTSSEEKDDDTFPRGFQLPQEHVRQPFRPDPHRTPIYHRPSTLSQQQIVDEEEKLPEQPQNGYNYPKPSRPFPEERPETDFRPFEPTTSRPTTEFIPFSPETEPETEIDSNLLQVQELNNPAPWRPEGFFVFELPSPVASHHQSVVYYTLPRLTNPVTANFKQPVKGKHFIPKVFYLPPDFYHQRGRSTEAFQRF